jgi:hypothetical protein
MFTQCSHALERSRPSGAQLDPYERRVYLNSHRESPFAALVLLILFSLTSCSPSAVGEESIHTEATSVIATDTSTPSQTPSLATGIPTAMYSYLYPKDLNDPVLVAAIQAVVLERFGDANFGGRPFCSFMLFAPPRADASGTISLYLEYLCQEFYIVNGILEEGSGGTQPVALRMAKGTEGWEVLECWTPQRGNWGPSIRSVFPPETWALVFTPDSRAIGRRNAAGHVVGQEVLRQADEFYGLPYVPTP